MQEAVEHLAFRGLLDLRRFAIELVLNLADELLENVLERHQSRRTAVFVDDNRHVHALLLKLSLQVFYRHRLGNEQDLALLLEQVFGARNLGRRLEQILDVNHADDVV